MGCVVSVTSLALRASLAILLVGSVVPKVWGTADSGSGTALVSRATLSFLRRHGFQAGEAQSDEDLPLIAAETVQCRLLVGVLSPLGWHRHVIRRMAGAGDEIKFLFEGKTYLKQPVWKTRAHHYWRQLHKHLGSAIPVRPALGIIAEPSCKLDDLPWRDLAEVPRD